MSCSQVGRHQFDDLSKYLTYYREWCECTGRHPAIFNKKNGKGMKMIVTHCPRTSDGVKRDYEKVTLERTVVKVQVECKINSDARVSLVTQLCEVKEVAPKGKGRIDQSATGKRRVAMMSMRCFYLRAEATA